jgi:hypothetical protein
MGRLKLDFGSFEILGKSRFSQFPGFSPGKTDHKTDIGIFDHLKTLGRFYPIVFGFWARLEVINCCPSVMWVRYVESVSSTPQYFDTLLPNDGRPV